MYLLLYCKGQMTSNHSIINVKTKATTKKTNKNKFAFNTHRIHTTLYHTYILFYCKGHIQMTRNHRIINVKTKATIKKTKKQI